MVAAAVWWFRGSAIGRSGPPPAHPVPWEPAYFTTAVLDSQWTAFRTSLRRSVDTVLRNGAGGDVVATLLVRFDTVPFRGKHQSIVLMTDDHVVELAADLGIVWPWQLNPLRTTYEVRIDDESIGTIEATETHVVARDVSGDVARWQTGVPLASILEGEEPRYAPLLGKASGSLRVPLRRFPGPGDFPDVPFFATADGDERWLLAFLAVAASASLQMR